MNAASAIRDEIKRNEQLLIQYAAIGPAGSVGATMIMNDLSSAHDAIHDQDVGRILLCWEKLRKNE